jgi:hypothetical protein
LSPRAPGRNKINYKRNFEKQIHPNSTDTLIQSRDRHTASIHQQPSAATIKQSATRSPSATPPPPITSRQQQPTNANCGEPQLLATVADQ